MPTRRCLASGQSLPQGELVRFVVGPDHNIVPDLAGKLPGRGLWVRARHDDVQLAADKNLFARAARQQVKASADLADLVGQLMRQNCLSLFGLARKAGDLTQGFEKVRAMLQSGKAAVLVQASDGSDDGCSKLRRISRDLPEIRNFTTAELGNALGRDNVVHIALKDGGLANRLVQEATRLTGYGPDVEAVADQTHQ